MRPATAMLLVLLAIDGACRFGEEGPCLQGARLDCTCASGVGGSQACGPDGTFGACVCADAARVVPAYAGCSPGQTCSTPTRCLPAGAPADSRPTLCSARCDVDADCPAAATGAPRGVTCVVSPFTGEGHCYARCDDQRTCGDGTVCFPASSRTDSVCLPGQPIVRPSPTPMYATCFEADECPGTSTCLATPVTSLDSHGVCTVGCARGDASTCPGYVPGAATQRVACVAPVGLDGGVCMRTCDPARGNADCPDPLAYCRALVRLEGVAYACSP